MYILINSDFHRYRVCINTVKTLYIARLSTSETSKGHRTLSSGLLVSEMSGSTVYNTICMQYIIIIYL